jgi:hypothetical protein
MKWDLRFPLQANKSKGKVNVLSARFLTTTFRPTTNAPFVIPPVPACRGTGAYPDFLTLLRQWPRVRLSVKKAA